MLNGSVGREDLSSTQGSNSSELPGDSQFILPASVSPDILTNGVLPSKYKTSKLRHLEKLTKWYKTGTS